MSVYEARNNLSALIKTAESGEVVEITRHDKPVVVMLKKEDFEKMRPKKNFWERFEEWKRNAGISNEELAEAGEELEKILEERRHDPMNIMDFSRYDKMWE